MTAASSRARFSASGACGSRSLRSWRRRSGRSGDQETCSRGRSSLSVGARSDRASAAGRSNTALTSQRRPASRRAWRVSLAAAGGGSTTWRPCPREAARWRSRAGIWSPRAWSARAFGVPVLSTLWTGEFIVVISEVARGSCVCLSHWRRERRSVFSIRARAIPYELRTHER